MKRIAREPASSSVLRATILAVVGISFGDGISQAQQSDTVSSFSEPNTEIGADLEENAYRPHPEEQWLFEELSKTERGKEAYTSFLITRLRNREGTDSGASAVPLALLTMSVFSCIIAVAFMHQAVRFRKWALRDQEGADDWSDQKTIRIGWLALGSTIAIWGGLHVYNNPSLYGDISSTRLEGYEAFDATMSAVLSDCGFLATGLLLAGTIPSVFAIYNFAVGLLVLKGRPGESSQGSFFAALVAFTVTTIGFVSSVVTIYAFMRD